MTRTWLPSKIKRQGVDVVRGLGARSPRLGRLLAESAGRWPATQAKLLYLMQPLECTLRPTSGPFASMTLDGLSVTEAAPVALGEMERAVTDFLVGLPLTDATAFDVGANYGYYTLLLSRAVGPGGRVYAFEPDPSSLRRLVRNIEVNKCANAVPVPLAVGRSGGLVRFDSNRESPWDSRVSTGEPSNAQVTPIVVAAATLDQFADFAGVIPRLVKIDVEGLEVDVVRGASRLLSVERPAFLIEIHGASLAGELGEIFEKAGYTSSQVEFSSDTRNHTMYSPSEWGH